MEIKNEEKSQIFSKEGIENISSFARTLQSIHSRLLMEGYVSKDDSVEKDSFGNINIRCKIQRHECEHRERIQ